MADLKPAVQYSIQYEGSRKLLVQNCCCCFFIILHSFSINVFLYLWINTLKTVIQHIHVVQFFCLKTSSDRNLRGDVGNSRASGPTSSREFSHRLVTCDTWQPKLTLARSLSLSRHWLRRLSCAMHTDACQTLYPVILSQKYGVTKKYYHSGVMSGVKQAQFTAFFVNYSRFIN